MCKKLLMQRIAFIQFRMKCKCRLIFAADGYDVAIDGCENCVKTAVSELEDLGFTPEVQG